MANVVVSPNINTLLQSADYAAARTLLNVADGATANSANATLLDRANHTGTQAASTISDFDTEVANNSAVTANTAKVTYPSADSTKLSGIATGATVNSADATLLARANHTGTQATATISDFPVIIQVAASDETTALTTGTAKLTIRAPSAFTLTGVRASVTTAPTGATIIVDINEGGVSVLSTKLSIDATEKTSTTAAAAAVISDSAIADDAELTIDIDQIGSTIAGAGLKITLIGTL